MYDPQRRDTRLSRDPAGRGPRPAGSRLFIVLTLLLMVPTGCSAVRNLSTTGGNVKLQSLTDEQLKLEGEFDLVTYSYDGEQALTVVLIDGPEAAPTRAVLLRFFWRPSPAQTPIDEEATNATVHYLVFPPDAGAALYAGAGYVFPTGNRAGSSRFAARVWDANLELADAAEGYADPWGPLRLRGGFTAERDDERTARLVRELTQRLSERLGYPRLVNAIP